MDFAALGENICGTEAPSFLGLFDFSTAPHLLFYAYIPIIIVSALFGSVIIGRNKDKSLRSRLLVTFLAFFILWVLNILVQWVASHHVVLMFAWQLTALIETGLYLSAAYFAYVFIYERDLPAAGKAVLTVVALAVTALTPTVLNVAAYDLENCQGVVGPLWQAMYGFIEPAVILSVLFIGLRAARTEHKGMHRRQLLIFTLGFVFFLSTFFISNVFGEITGVYEFNLWGPLGLAVFFLLLGYMMVKFQTFHAKLIAAEVLVWTLSVLIGSQFFFITSPINRNVNGITFIASIVFGVLLIRSVRKEIEQKEQLSLLLEQRERLEYLISHKVKGAFTRMKFIFAEALEGTFGPIDEKLRDMSRQGLGFSNDGIETVESILNAANLKKGNIEYDMQQVDFKELVAQTVHEKIGPVQKKGLALVLDAMNGDYRVTGDAFWLKEVIYNLIDNAQKYTPTGTITVGLRSEGGQVHFWVKDTGPGISDEDKKVLFTEGGHGKESTKVNPDSTGYGLYTIKLVVEAHKGRVWADSTLGKGSGFFVEIPLTGK